MAKEVPERSGRASGLIEIINRMNDRLSSDGKIAPTLSTRHALFLDFDGTLAPLQDDPDTVALPDGGEDCLRALSRQLGGALVLISGRGLQDLSLRTPIDVWRAGGHGQDVALPGERPGASGEAAPADLVDAVNKLVGNFDHVRVEQKGKVLAIHYRLNALAGPDLAAAAERLATASNGYVFQHGNRVIELKPVGANKGSALTRLMDRSPFSGRVPIMIGDDTTDEDAMLAAQKLGGTGIKVGSGETCAEYRFNTTETVWRWLREQLNEHA